MSPGSARRAVRIPGVATLLFALASSIPGGGAAQQRDPASAWDGALAEFSAQVARQVEEDGIGGIAVGVAVDGDLAWARGFGWADRDRRTP